MPRYGTTSVRNAGDVDQVVTLLQHRDAQLLLVLGGTSAISSEAEAQLAFP